MAWGSNKNRRRQDATQKREAVKGAVRSHGTSVLKGLLLSALTAALVWGGVELRHWALTSPTFELKETTFSGLGRATPGELVKLSGLTGGENLFELDVDALERAMLTHPWVRAVEVTRHLPASVSVEVTEHVPVALAVLNELYLLDEQGEPFKRVTPGDGVDLPLVTGVEREVYMADEAGVRERFLHALEVAAAYEASHPPERERLSEVRLTEVGVVLVTASGLEVRLGEGETEARLARLVRVREALAKRGLAAQVIHLDNRARPGWVAVKLSSPVSERNGASAR